MRSQLQGAEVAHFDETGGRIAGGLSWIHCASTGQLTLYTVNSQRGRDGIDAAGVLPGFDGTAVHDGWASALLLDAKEAVGAGRVTGEHRLSDGAPATLRDCYRDVIALGYEQNPAWSPDRGGPRPKRTKAENLLLRLDHREAEALRFAHDFRVPFDNNLCERDLRMVKLQQKISGCWRTTEGAERFLKVRSDLSTARKQGQRPVDVLLALGAGQPWLPLAAGP